MYTADFQRGLDEIHLWIDFFRVYACHGFCLHRRLLQKIRIDWAGYVEGAKIALRGDRASYMTLLLTMLPVYLLGNLHCLGMCGPLVMMIGRHKYRYYYFFGRILSYSLVGAAAGAFGAVLNIFLHHYHIPAATSLIFGALIALIGIWGLMQWKGPSFHGKRTAKVSSMLSLLLLRDLPFPTFLFGFFTVMLPCGQTLIVFSACALSGSPWIGLLNAFAFACLTSPSLWLSMRMQGWMAKFKKNYNVWMGIAAIFVGGVSVARGLADLGIIDHLSYQLTEQVHLVLY